jgi:hypothetical protein
VTYGLNDDLYFEVQTLFSSEKVILVFLPRIFGKVYKKGAFFDLCYARFGLPPELLRIRTGAMLFRTKGPKYASR